MSNLKQVTAARETSYAVSIYNVPKERVRPNAKQPTAVSSRPTAEVKFQVKAIGASQALEQAKTRVRAMGYVIRAANHTASGIVIYITEKT